MTGKTSRMNDDQAREHRSWILLDAKDQILGRLASRAATILLGKDKAHYQRDIEIGDFLVIINAQEIALSRASKKDDKIYYHHTGYPGGIKGISFRDQMKRHPDRPLRDAIYGMLPKNRLRQRLMRRLHVYPGPQHPHAAQSPCAATVPSQGPMRSASPTNA